MKDALPWFAGLFASSGLWAADVNVGVGRAVITPDEPVWLCGYGGRNKPAEGKVHDLFAKCLILESAPGRLVLVTLDLGSVSQQITDAVLGKVAGPHGIRRDQLILNVSHTHCAPEVAAERRVFHDLPDQEDAKLTQYTAVLVEKIVGAINQAMRNRAPASLTYSEGQARFARNRRLPTPTGFVNAQNDAGIVDHDVPVLAARDPAGRLRAVLFGYACHNTTLAFQFYCGDYAGLAQEFIEEQQPGTTALFLMGCGGDVNPYPRHGAEGLEHARRHGKELADAVQAALAGQQRAVKGSIRTGLATATLNLEPLPTTERLTSDAAGPPGIRQRKARHLLRAKDQPGFALTQACPVHAADIGADLRFVFFSGETVLDYARSSRRDFAGPIVWPAGYCTDVFAYLPSKRVLLEGGYEGREGIIHQLTPTPFLPTVEERVMEATRAAITTAR